MDEIDLDAGAERALHRFSGRLDYPMFVVTTVAGDDGERSGCLVGFATQCSIHPPRWAVWLSVVNHTYRVAERADVLAVHALSASERGRELAELFGAESGDEIDKFSRCAWSPGHGGVPILDAGGDDGDGSGVAGWFAGPILDRFPPVGDHRGFLVEPAVAWVADDDARTRLGYQSVKRIEPGHEP